MLTSARPRMILAALQRISSTSYNKEGEQVHQTLIDLLEFPYQILTLRTCLHGSGGTQVGEVTCYGQVDYPT